MKLQIDQKYLKLTQNSKLSSIAGHEKVFKRNREKFFLNEIVKSFYKSSSSLFLFPVKRNAFLRSNKNEERKK